jgi:poly(hydroxyalkanoate) depolymerase family esterase
MSAAKFLRLDYRGVKWRALRDESVRHRTPPIVAGICVAAAAVAVGIISSTSTTSPQSGSPYQHGRLSEQGNVYDYTVYVPSSLRGAQAAPLVVVLHGCNMTADQVAAASQYSALAERDRFIVLYPEVDALDADGHGRCWMGIWAPDIGGRGTGDAGAIAGMTAAVTRRWHADPGRVYVIGISAGAFEAAILGVYYPDLYAAIGIHSGAAYTGGEPECLRSTGDTPSTSEPASAAIAAMGRRARVVPVIVIHGDADSAVPYQCGQQAITQWLAADNQVLNREHRPGVPDSPAAVRRAVIPGGHPYTVLSYTDRSGCVVAQFWTIHGMGHFWSGGSADPSVALYSDPRGPSATAASWAFFSRWRLSGPVSPC